VSGYLPSAHNLMGAVGLLLALAVLRELGAAATGRRTQPDIALVSGWGLACLVFTLWGVLTPWSLRLPAAALGVAALALAVRRLVVIGWPTRPAEPRHLRRAILPTPSVARVLVLMAPLWLVMCSVRPSQIDTWLNLLPNAAYLFDHDLLPTALRPPSYSFLPVAPYNTQFIAYLASLASCAFADSAMSLLNLALLSATGLLFARVVAATDGTPSWRACAFGLLLAVPLNPGFVPRDFLSSYGEAPLAVTTLFAVWLAAEMLGELGRGVAWPKSLRALAAALVAVVNIKQSGIGLVMPIGASVLALAWSDPRIPRRRATVAISVTFAPGMCC
jgi:hypothetical protein